MHISLQWKLINFKREKKDSSYANKGLKGVFAKIERGYRLTL